ncbi:ATP-dependent RNA helicase HrpA [Kineosporiaceae bacterium SCSIO 59966]|nr:ATP-dependent RNA helicase HrpA [Kineosporiaceae bacterium SCSIO 59966]
MSALPAVDPLQSLHGRLAGLTLADERRLRRRLDGVRSLRDEARRQRALTQVEAALDQAEQRVARRRASVPQVSYPEELPVSRHREQIAAAIRDHQVVVVAGETGSGKTTQLPKICLELGRGVRGTIGHTQPRRIAARSVAERVAEELGGELGGVVGYKVRFTDSSRQDTLVKVMTDGVLLAEIQNDRSLLRYDTIIIDEAHERSLNIDFLLGYLKQLLPRRPDLKVVITSATIDPDRFSRHFDGAPVIEVSGRTYPVEVRYEPYDPEETDQVQAVCDAVSRLAGEAPGDVLVFLSGEREIRDTADALRAMSLRGTEVLPLYARLSAAEQHRVFSPHPGRRVVLATNVAETSLTVPGIRYVVDAGTARISRYSHRTKVQRLPIEPVSQASARQRAGRCGRVADGVAVRLYSEEDLHSRPEYTDPEILRTNLASVILRMSALGLGDVAAFPFVDPPDPRQVRDGLALLHELGAIDPDEKDPRRRLTPLGRRLAQFPVDPRLGRMVLEADANGAVHEVLVIAAALSVQDPRERPADRQQAADEAHRRFRHETSDFLAYLNLWNHVTEQQKALSSSAFRRMCRTEFLSYLRVREWQDLYAQLREVARSVDVSVNRTPATPEQVHRSLLAGLLSHIGLKQGDRNDYLGARGTRFAVFPGSALFRRPPAWVMAAELVETSRLWGREVARIEPEWAEAIAGHLVKRVYSEPHWSKKQGAVMAQEKVLLFGVPLVAARRVGYAAVDPETSRELFIRRALVEGDWDTHHRFFHRNRELLADVEDLEHRARRRDILVDDETLFDFYDRRVPADVVSARHFDAWWKRERHRHPDLLTFDLDLLVNPEAGDVDERDYPRTWRQGLLELPLSYQFEPGSDADGVTVHVPLAVLNQVTASGFDWQVPGLRADLVTALIRGLPKPVRKQLVPAPDRAREVLARLPAEPDGRTLTRAVADELHRTTGVDVPDDAWDPTGVPDHLRVTFRVEDDSGRRLAEGKDLEALRRRLAPDVAQAVARAVTASGAPEPARETASAGGTTPALDRTGLTGWDVDTLPRVVEQVTASGHLVRGYPALVDAGGRVDVRVLPTEAEQRRATWAGQRRLLLAEVPSPGRVAREVLDNAGRLALTRNPHGSVDRLLEDCAACAVDTLMTTGGAPVWDAADWERLAAHVRGSAEPVLADVVRTVARVLADSHAVAVRLDAAASLPLLPSLADARAQLDALVHPGFVTATGARRLPDLLRYLRALHRRLDKLPEDPARDRDRTGVVQRLAQEYARVVDRLPEHRREDDDVVAVRWMLEELRVSLFAQGVGTAHPVSEKRIRKAFAALSP